MRIVTVFLIAVSMGLGLSAVVLASGPSGDRIVDAAAYRPQIVFHDLDHTVAGEYVTVTGVVFSRAPLDRVVIGERVAMIRPAEPKDLVRLARVPDGASDAPFRTYFEVPDAGLARVGANDLSVRATSADGRVSDVHRITVIKTSQAAQPEA